MNVRAKFRCIAVTHRENDYWDIELTAQYDDSIPEDRRFAKATPTGTFKMSVTRAEVADAIVPGKCYYLDFTPVP